MTKSYKKIKRAISIASSTYKNKEFLYNECILKQKSAKQIAKELDVSVSTVWTSLKKFDIKSKNAYYQAFRNKEDLTDKRFGKLIAISPVPENERIIKGKSFWYCKCDCGETSQVQTMYLINGRITSCRGKLHYHEDYKEIGGNYLQQIKRGAKYRNLELSISDSFIWDLYIKQERKCALSGQNIDFNTEYRSKSSMQTASLDRIDSSKGYTTDNVQWIHKDINKIKMNFPEEKFLSMIKQIYDYKIKPTLQ